MFIQKCLARHYEARCAKTALLGVVIDKGGHDGVELAIVREPFDSHNFVSLGLYGEQVTRIDRFAVQNDRARAANPAIAHLFGPRKVQVIPQSIEQRDAWLQIQLVRLTISSR